MRRAAAQHAGKGSTVGNMPSAHDDPDTSGHTGATAGDDRFDWASMTRHAALAVVLLVPLWLVFNVQLPSADRLRDLIAAGGGAAWLVFLGSYAAGALAPLPVTV